MASLSHIIGRVCAHLLEPAREAESAIAALRRSDLRPESRGHCEMAREANAKLLSVLTAVSELQAIEEGRLELAPHHAAFVT